MELTQPSLEQRIQVNFPIHRSRHGGGGIGTTSFPGLFFSESGTDTRRRKALGTRLGIGTSSGNGSGSGSCSDSGRRSGSCIMVLAVVVIVVHGKKTLVFR